MVWEVVHLLQEVPYVSCCGLQLVQGRLLVGGQLLLCRCRCCLLCLQEGMKASLPFQAHVDGCRRELWRRELCTEMQLKGSITNLVLLLLGHSSHLLPAELLRYHQIAGLPAVSRHGLNGSGGEGAYGSMACGSAVPTSECFQELTAIASC